jgi:hypothetical protein
MFSIQVARVVEEDTLYRRGGRIAEKKLKKV